MFGFKNWLQRKGHWMCTGDNSGIVTIHKEKMSEYEKQTIPNPRILTRSRTLYGYVFDLVYFNFKALPNIEFAMEFDFGPEEEEYMDVEGQSIPNFILGTIYVYDLKKEFAENWSIQFWNTCLAEQIHWFEQHAVQYVRKRCKETNWLIRKNFLITFCHPVQNQNVHSTAVSEVFNNQYLIHFIALFI